MCYFSIFLFGLVFGSFANVCIYRMPRELSISKPRSFCPGCKKTVRWYDNVPLLSYCILKGRCRHCGSKISIEYPLVEFLTGVVFLLIYNRFYMESHVLLAMFLVYGFLLIIISGIDFHHKIIPDLLSYSMMLTGILLSPFNGFFTLSLPSGITGVFGMTGMLFRVFMSVSGLLVSGIVFYLIAIAGEQIFKKEAMGGGDIKLIAAIGAYVGIINVLWVIFISSLIGGLAGLILILLGKKNRLDTIPFGPYISLGALIIILVQPYLNQWYLAYLIK